MEGCQTKREQSEHKYDIKVPPLSISVKDIRVRNEATDGDEYTPFTPKEFKYEFQIHKNIENRSKLNYYHILKTLLNKWMNPMERKLLYLTIFFACCRATLRLIFFIFIAAIFDVVSNTYDANNYTLHSLCDFHGSIKCETKRSLVNVFIATLFILAIVSSIFALLESISITYAVNTFVQRLHCLIFDKMIESELSFFDCTQKRDLRHLSIDLKAIHKAIHRIKAIIESMIHLLCSAIFLFIYNWDIGLILIGSFILLMCISFAYIYHNNAIYLIRENSFKIVMMKTVEMLNYITTIKTFSKEDDEKFLYQLCVSRAFEYDSHKHMLLVVYKCFASVVAYVTILSVIWYGAYKYSAGILVLNLFILIQLKVSLFQVVTLSNTVSFDSMNRILNILNMDNDTNVLMDNVSLLIPDNETINGLVEFNNVSFSYPTQKRNKMIIDNISLHFKPKSLNALVGNIGSGKQSLFKLLMKFYDVDKGEILIDGVNINEYNMCFLRTKIGYISQNINLFKSRSISDNIKFGMKLDRAQQESHHALQLDLLDNVHFDETDLYFWREFKGINQTDVENACKIANIHGFIANLKQGYDTIIGGKSGIKLSRGEKIRIGVARAILLNPSIFLLDEALFIGSDAITKYLMEETLNKIVDKRCAIIIARRLKTLKKANMIYVINEGKVVQKGTHNELIDAENSYYSKIIKTMS